MKKLILNSILTFSTLACGLCSCSSIGSVSRGVKYSNYYKEQPRKIAILPVINCTDSKECVPYFENTADSILLLKGYEICKNTSGADACFVTTIKSWHTSKVEGLFEANVVYLIRSLSTNDTLYVKEGFLSVDCYIKLGGGRLINLIATSIKSNTMNKTWVGKTCASYLLSDLPEGHLRGNYLKDMNMRAGKNPIQKKIKCLHSLVSN